jgi:digeranylgeranylglycerophospholipid reductase
MQATSCDVFVVGAGPSGCSAARAAAAAGAETIIIDKKAEIGVPVQCAEAIGEYLIPYLPYPIPPEQLIWKTNGMLLWADDVAIERTGGTWSGYAINRANFDKWLAKAAVAAGAKLQLESELIDLEFDGPYRVASAIVKTRDGEVHEIIPRVTIAADGVHSRVLNKLGFTDLEKNCVEVMSFELKDVELHKLRLEQLYLGDFAPGAYGYIFPISPTRANVGVGVLSRMRHLEVCYEEFLELPVVKHQLKRANQMSEKSGWAPIRYFTEKWAYGNVLLTGDAANQNFKPFVEGILPGIICGDLAGKTAVDLVADKATPDTYAARIEERLGSLFAESDRYLEVLYELSKSLDKRSHLLRLGVSVALFSPLLDQLRAMDYVLIRQQLLAASRQRTVE